MLFVRPDGTWTTAMLLLAMCMPLGLISFPWGVSAFVAALVLATCNAIEDIKEEDKLEIRYNVISAEDIVRELVEWQSTIQKSKTETRGDGDVIPSADLMVAARLHVDTALMALARKHDGRAQIPSDISKVDDDSLPILCQEASYIALRVFHNDTAIIASALSLLALTAKDPRLRARYLSNQEFPLRLPVQAMRNALLEAKTNTSGGTEIIAENSEQQAAELQRKGCLLLGVLSDGNRELAQEIVKVGGLDAVVEAMKWFRYHEDVANWALWSIFQISYENTSHKCKIISLDGVSLVLEVMRNCPDSIHVARHGIAVLFDIMREPDPNDNLRVDIWLVRKQAVDAGIHALLVAAMEEFSGAMDIMVMGAEMLAGTNYEGRIPQFDPTVSMEDNDSSR